ncbi:uncharacterized protein LOC142931749, partial [Anarhichas minor]|uniref:uncharacterized protein LOC142931749 n=1 Tax=Anarhichas minor TaxID=65739 RepID=UPI003F735194
YVFFFPLPPIHFLSLFVSSAHILPYSFPLVCVIIPLTPRSTQAAFILQTRSPFCPSPTPTPPPTPLTPTAALHCRPFSPRRSLSYESSISLKDLAPPALFKPPKFNFLSSPPPCLISQCLSTYPRKSPAFPFSPRPSSPIPLITSPLSPSPAANSPITSSVPCSPTSVPTSPSLTTPAPNPSVAEPNAFSLTLSGSTSDISCHTTAPSITATTPANLTLITPVPPIPSSPSGFASPSVTASPSKESLVTQLASSSRPVSPLSLSTLPLVSTSGSRCPSPTPSSPPLRYLSPCPACQCSFVPAISPPPPRTPIDPSTAEILF